MKEFLHVINSDATNLYGDRFTAGALISGLYDSCISGMSLFIAHDFSRLIGWSFPKSVYFEPGLTRLIDIGYKPEGDDEHQQLQNRMSHHLYLEIKDNPESENLRQMLQGNLSSDAKLILNECIAFVDDDLTYRVFPELRQLQDDDGLILLSELAPIGPGVFKKGEYAIFAHHYFRRNLFRLNTLNYPFLEKLQNLKTSQIIPKIALDPHMVGLASTYNGGRLELAYWWGPKFDDKLERMPTGVTRHNSEDREKFFYGITRTEFRWGSNKNLHIFEAEEIRDSPTKSDLDEKYGCRYVHSIVSEENGRVEHLDGSIRMYSELEMIERLDTDLAHAPRKTEYTKLWRLDAPINVAVWKSLISDYYRDNFLVGEYLGAEKLDKSIWNPKTVPSTLESKYIPYSLRPDDGLRIAVTFMTPENLHASAGQFIIPHDFIGNDKHSDLLYIEAEAIEIKKALLRTGLDVEIDNSVKFVTFRDKYLNLPVIYFAKDNLTESLETTIRAFEILLNSWNWDDSRQVVSFTFRYPVDQTRDVQISVAGCVTELMKWVKNPLSRPPIRSMDWHDWADKVSRYLRENYPENIDRIPLLSLLQSSGILLLNREKIEYKEFHIGKDSLGIKYELSFSDSVGPIANDLISHNIVPGFAWLIVDGQCSKCKQSYFQCDCSKLLDDGVTLVIKDLLPAFPFWTDKPAPIVME